MADKNGTKRASDDTSGPDAKVSKKSEPEVLTYDERPMDLNGWKSMWEKGDDKIWNYSEPHKFVTDNYEALLNGQKTVKILFPMCGKDIHMLWFAEKGHDVVGVEGVEVGVINFFEENKIKYTSEDVDDVENCKVFKSDNKALKIKIYVCDVMNFSSSLESGFDAVWDRGGFGALPINLRKGFCDIMLSAGMLKSDCRYYLETFAGQEDDSEDGLTESDLKKHFRVGQRFTMERLTHEEFDDVSDYKKEHGVGFCEQGAGEMCQPDPDCKEGCAEKASAGAEECKHGLDHSAPDYAEEDWKLWVQVHLLTPITTST